ncbi:MauE/DoxX family redox-associated membrane protein [Streptomyces sp. NPDC054884]|uniref:MauE/DoxX family redox-associated membrane protein n=1 Tax=Streptomyces sp. ME08-AFT2 TaxID=3028683 RepID=UPI0029A3FD74|nr:MauE/DoxX family redox-associated membrane protein [Streptomyces sp. ME08-AFT2]MDX3312769.1 hypothetical protein [Streptomyces sp. ME08-AFT2]
MTYIELGLRLSLAGVFLVSGLAKARAIDVVALMSTKLFDRILPKWRRWSVKAAWGLVALEVMIGIALLFQGVRIFSLIVATGLLASFVLLALFSARNVVRLDCACFGKASTSLGWRHVWRNCTLLLFGVAALSVPSENNGHAFDIGGVGASVTAAAVVTLVTFFYDETLDMLSGNW